MQKVRKFRLLRLQYHITRAELAEAAGISPQRVSQLELDLTYRPKKAERKIAMAFEQVISSRGERVDGLRQTFQRHRDSLMEPVEETNHEL